MTQQLIHSHFLDQISTMNGTVKQFTLVIGHVT